MKLAIILALSIAPLISHADLPNRANKNKMGSESIFVGVDVCAEKAEKWFGEYFKIRNLTKKQLRTGRYTFCSCMIDNIREGELISAERSKELNDWVESNRAKGIIKTKEDVKKKFKLNGDFNKNTIAVVQEKCLAETDKNLIDHYKEKKEVKMVNYVNPKKTGSQIIHINYSACISKAGLNGEYCGCLIDYTREEMIDGIITDFKIMSKRYAKQCQKYKK